LLLTTSGLEALGNLDFAVEIPAENGAAVGALGGDEAGVDDQLSGRGCQNGPAGYSMIEGRDEGQSLTCKASLAWESDFASPILLFFILLLLKLLKVGTRSAGKIAFG